ncbi:uncharacterized protein C8R40DRAFT_1197717 [Lentinula edodes]|uniref:uncharacterized protein n=1 Tax=Lentinula edodes TaxID=5353 RepID=UPI001E8E19C7|nr:uncharacterized protein C8R40DRAFT_1197717 [Lentinula edodes]KAH7873685.1 hypothetical protein C8R40DRAFT_1197717 [Lentinula edodes]
MSTRSPHDALGLVVDTNSECGDTNLEATMLGASIHPANLPVAIVEPNRLRTLNLLEPITSHVAHAFILESERPVVIFESHHLCSLITLPEPTASHVAHAPIAESAIPYTSLSVTELNTPHFARAPISESGNQSSKAHVLSCVATSNARSVPISPVDITVFELSLLAQLDQQSKEKAPSKASIDAEEVLVNRYICTYALAIEALLGGPNVMAIRVGIYVQTSLVAAQLLMIREAWHRKCEDSRKGTGTKESSTLSAEVEKKADVYTVKSMLAAVEEFKSRQCLAVSCRPSYLSYVPSSDPSTGATAVRQSGSTDMLLTPAARYISTRCIVLSFPTSGTGSNRNGGEHERGSVANLVGDAFNATIYVPASQVDSAQSRWSDARTLCGDVSGGVTANQVGIPTGATPTPTPSTPTVTSGLGFPQRGRGSSPSLVLEEEEEYKISQRGMYGASISSMATMSSIGSMGTNIAIPDMSLLSSGSGATTPGFVKDVNNSSSGAASANVPEISLKASSLKVKDDFEQRWWYRNDVGSQQLYFSMTWTKLKELLTAKKEEKKQEAVGRETRVSYGLSFLSKPTRVNKFGTSIKRVKTPTIYQNFFTSGFTNAWGFFIVISAQGTSYWRKWLAQPPDVAAVHETNAGRTCSFKDILSQQDD